MRAFDPTAHTFCFLDFQCVPEKALSQERYRLGQRRVMRVKRKEKEGETERKRGLRPRGLGGDLAALGGHGGDLAALRLAHTGCPWRHFGGF